MAKKLTRTSVTKSATSSPQLIKELIALGVTSYKTPELEFTVHPGAVTKALPKVEVKEKVEEIDYDEKAFQLAMGRKP